MITFSPLPWSYSKLSLYEQCGLKAALTHPAVGERPARVAHPAAVRGEKIHAELERWLKRKAPAIPDEAVAFKRELFELRQQGAAAEEPWWFDEGWEPLKRKAARWLTVVTDATTVKGDALRLVDFKTGKVYDTHEDQGSLYALAAFKRSPRIVSVNVEFWYLDQARMREMRIKRRSERALQSDYERRVGEMVNKPDLSPRPNRFCPWCPFRRDAGGPCPAA